MNNQKPQFPSTQKYLNISEIRNDCVILQDGTLRAVLLVSSINFSLKSEEEQNAVIQAYVQFLNSLDFPIQIVIQSRPFNINPYLTQLEELKRTQTNDLLKAQMADYIDFTRELIQMGEIMSKRFYIVVPYNPLGDKKRSFASIMTDVLSAASVVKLKREKFEKYREILFRRMDNVLSNLSSMGIKAISLDTQSLIELFYNTYNPSSAQNQKLVEIKDLRVE
ncbi:MAG: TraC family protein [Patescibacteria group bacterium]|nr:TraC family protein [Patescibacteria group bacterium]MDD5164572.1 TraC family protein [Patescibacteria group bacterium]MDD5534303.1 TraC family protein [Patescibacteria group bacterium]